MHSDNLVRRLAALEAVAQPQAAYIVLLGDDELPDGVDASQVIDIGTPPPYAEQTRNKGHEYERYV